MRLARGWVAGVSMAGLVAVAACGPPSPYVRYAGTNFGRAPKPVQEMEVLRASSPEGRFQDLGTVTVTCPSQAEHAFGAMQMTGGCSYEWAVWQASNRAAANGADGIRAIETTMSSSGRVITLIASVFVRLPPHVAAAPPPAPPDEKTAKPPVEERLRHLDKLKADGLITPEEHARRREEILKEI
ncbi:MAG TPA: SHOCT domain-containing protein [Polyangia bacterium]|nr:SHOCT domain-containing protein [Polyangia bacterium]